MRARTSLLVLLANVLVALALIWFFPPTGDFRLDNPFWNGLSRAAEILQAEPAVSITGLPENPRGYALILIPYTPLAEWELEFLKEFVAGGGVLLLMDDYGYGNQALEALKLGVRFTGKPLLDPLFNYRGPQLPKAVLFSSLIGDVRSVVMNHPSALNLSVGCEVLAWSSSFSFQDLDGDLKLDRGEPVGRFPVAARVRLGAGWVIAVSDPSILINGMLKMDGNLLFIQRLLEVHGVNAVFIDQAHLPRSSLEEAKEVLRIAYVHASSPAGVAATLTLTLIICLAPLWRGGLEAWRS